MEGQIWNGCCAGVTVGQPRPSARIREPEWLAPEKSGGNLGIAVSSPGSPRPEGGLQNSVRAFRQRLQITEHFAWICAGSGTGPRYLGPEMPRKSVTCRVSGASISRPISDEAAEL